MNNKKRSLPDDPEEDSDSYQIIRPADQEIKGPLTDADDDCESFDSLMNSEILAMIEDVEVKSDRLELVPKVSDQVTGQADEEIKKPITDEDDVCKSDDSLMNSEILALIEDVEVKSDRLELVPKVSDQITGQADKKIKKPIADGDDVCESDDSLMNSEILALIEDVEVKSDKLVSVPKVSEQISGEVDQELKLKKPLTYESDDILMNSDILAMIEDIEVKSSRGNESEESSMNSEILAMIEDVEVKSHGVNESEESSMNSEILAMIEDVEVESNERVKKNGTDLTGLTSSKALKVSKRTSDDRL